MEKLPDKERAIKDLKGFQGKLEDSLKKIEKYKKEKSALELKLQTLHMQNDSHKHGVKYLSQVSSNLSNKIEYLEHNLHRAKVATESTKNKFNLQEPKLRVHLKEKFVDMLQTLPVTPNNENLIQQKEALETRINENNQLLQQLRAKLFQM